MKLKNIAPTLLFGTIIFVQFHCANPVSPTGGPKDQEPPKIKNSKIIETNGKKKIIITFDENIQFKNSIELSPYRKNEKANVINSRNTLEILLDSNTNSINFNDAIKDLNEGNQGNYPYVIIGKDSGIKYYKVQSIPKNKENVCAYSSNQEFIYPYNTSKFPYVLGEGLPNEIELNTFIFLDKNKNKSYDSLEWAWVDSKRTYKKPLIQKDSLGKIIYSAADTLQVYMYPPIQQEIKYWYDSNQSKSALICEHPVIREKLLKSAPIEQIHGDTMLVNHIDRNTTNFNNLYTSIPNIKIKNQRIVIKGSNKKWYYMFVMDNDTLFFKEECLPMFNVKIKKTEGLDSINIDPLNTNSLKNSEPRTNKKNEENNKSPLILDMTNPFMNPGGSAFQDVVACQDAIIQISQKLNLKFISYIELQKELLKEQKLSIKDNSSKDNTAKEKENSSKIKPKELKKLGKIQIQNDSNFIAGLSIYKEGREIYSVSIPSGNIGIILPVGNYQYFTWRDKNEDQLCTMEEEILEYFFEMDVLEKIENTIIVKKSQKQVKSMNIPTIKASE